MKVRRLVAIMFSDIVGYTSMMANDEKKAFDTIKKNRRIHWKLIKKYRGRWLKEMGDGTLASFSSSMDAVMCAISIQLAAEEMDIPLRIGIHQGDVVFEQKDVLGDGVNIAARIQGVAETQGIAISETIYREIRNKEGLELVSLGTKNLKGAFAPMDVYKVSCTDPNILDYKVDTGELIKPIGKQRISLIAGLLITTFLVIAFFSIVKNTNYFEAQDNSVLVLPFDDFTGIDTLDYVVAGMHNELIGNIGRITGLRVLGKTTANAYKDTDKSLTEIGRERDVKTIIEGALSCFGEDSICFIAKVMEVYPKEKQVGVEEFRVSRSQIPSLYNMVTKEFTKAIDLTLTPEDEKFLAESRTVNKEAYDEYLKARSYWIDMRKESLDTALNYLNSAIEKEPDWAPLYAGLAEVWLWVQQGGWEPTSVTAPIIYKNLNKAMELDPNLAEIHYVSALIAHWVEWDWEKSEREFLKTLAINPNDHLARLLYAQLLLILHRNEESRAQRELAYKLDALNPHVQLLYLGTLILAGDYKAALAVGEAYLAAHPTDMSVNYIIGSTAYRLGDYDKVIGTWKYSFPFLMVGDVYEGIVNIYNESGIVAAHKALMVHYEKYAENNPVSYNEMFRMYLHAGQIDKALDWIEKGFEMHDPQITYIATDRKRRSPIEEELFRNPRFRAICEKANLPMPKK
jgi:adenylate cyclase